jgi:DNA-binding Lrp family transcriptional regulator
MRRRYIMSVELDYDANGRATTTDLADEMKATERRIREMLKTRQASGIVVTITAGQAEEA